LDCHLNTRPDVEDHLIPFLIRRFCDEVAQQQGTASNDVQFNLIGVRDLCHGDRGIPDVRVHECNPFYQGYFLSTGQTDEERDGRYFRPQPVADIDEASREKDKQLESEAADQDISNGKVAGDGTCGEAEGERGGRQSRIFCFSFFWLPVVKIEG
jgi:hypothetical protein